MYIPLQGLATVVISLADVNDEPPRFAQKDWYVEVDEELGQHQHHHQPDTGRYNQSWRPLLILSVRDADRPATNHFRYKIIAEHYSTKFERIRPNNYSLSEAELQADFQDVFQLVEVVATSQHHAPDRVDAEHNGNDIASQAELRMLKPLDYEIPEHKFVLLKVLVTDMQGSWQSIQPYHLDVAFVHIKLRDVNDNRPTFAQAFQNVSLPESMAVGTIVTKFYATDADQGGHAPVVYALDKETNRRQHFAIDQEGFVRLAKGLDRETTPMHVLKVLATDTDRPRLTATATLIVNVEDVNDNAPSLVNSTLPPIAEGSGPSKIGHIYAFDRDDYARGNGPPFTFYIDPSAPERIKRLFRLEVDFSGEGRATLYTTSVLDREQQKEYRVPIVVRDSGYPPMSATCAVTVVVGDVNDNDMADGWKTVLVYIVEPPGDTIRLVDHFIIF